MVEGKGEVGGEETADTGEGWTAPADTGVKVVGGGESGIGADRESDGLETGTATGVFPGVLKLNEEGGVTFGVSDGDCGCVRLGCGIVPMNGD